jgi:hypothetical protein
MNTILPNNLSSISVPPLTTANIANLTGSYTYSNAIHGWSSPSFSLNNSNNNTFTFMSNALDRGPVDNTVKRYEVVESPEDVLALSVTWNRIRKAKVNTGISNLLHPDLISTVTHEDVDKANEIRDYYSKKIMLWKLLGKTLTSFREQLNNAVHGNTKIIRNEILGLLYYLPDFHEYDVQVDSLKEHINVRKINSDVLDNRSKLKITEPIKRIQYITKKSKQAHYWFKDIDNEIGIRLAIDLSNPLEQLFKTVFSKQDRFEFTATLYHSKIDDFEFLSIKKWDLTEI